LAWSSVGGYGDGGELDCKYKTETGLTVRCVEDRNVYRTKIKVTDKELAKVKLEPDAFHGEWNYTIKAKTKNIK
jgi:hypothetical protein